MKIIFGTDGWRGVMADAFTRDNVRRITNAVATWLDEQGTAGKGVAIGYDRRFMSRSFAELAAGVLAARGVPVLLADAYVPTPVVSWPMMLCRSPSFSSLIRALAPPTRN